LQIAKRRQFRPDFFPPLDAFRRSGAITNCVVANVNGFLTRAPLPGDLADKMQMQAEPNGNGRQFDIR
jgi:hypothetical protein